MIRRPTKVIKFYSVVSLQNLRLDDKMIRIPYKIVHKLSMITQMQLEKHMSDLTKFAKRMLQTDTLKEHIFNLVDYDIIECDETRTSFVTQYFT